MKKILPFLLVLSAYLACTPFEENDIDLPAQPAAPVFSMEILASDPNRVVVTDLSSGFFDRTWDFPGGIPAKSKRAVDTIFYPKAGDYTLTLFAAGQGGGGVSQSTKLVKIEQDATAQCDPQLGLLTGDCGPSGKCWTFSRAANAIVVGPVPGSSEWYKSPVNGLQDAQYDDRFCFYFDGSHFQYENNGQTIDPWNGYAAVPFTPPTDLTWFVSKGTGDMGVDQIVLPTGAFIGTWDSGPVYDIAKLSDTELVLRSKILNGTGWFEFTLVKN